MTVSSRDLDWLNSAIVSDLTSRLDGEVAASPLRTALYTTDASNYRVEPRVVVYPRTQSDLVAAFEYAQNEGIALTVRGGGTSVAGNAIGPGIVVDTSRYLNRIHDVDPETATALVEPGVVLSDIQREAAKHGLRFGPDPSTINRATIGGAIANDACGAHSLAFGRTSHNVVDLDVIDGYGRRYWTTAGTAVVPGLDAIAATNLAVLRTEFGRFGRQVSGYAMQHLLPENGPDLTRLLVGSEGTLATVVQARVRLVPVVRRPVLVVLGFPDMIAAADAVPAIIACRPQAVEGMDSRLVDVVKKHVGARAVPPLPRGKGWLFVEVDESDGSGVIDTLVAAAGAVDSRVVRDPAQAAALWRIRADGVGLAGRTPSGDQAWPGWEDAAVPPENLGTYLRDFYELMYEHDVDGLSYGHFGDGCIHARINFPLERDAAVFRAFMEGAAALVLKYGGSLSGEHGDGRARSELLAHMYSPQAIAVQQELKSVFDPDNFLNPGVIVTPDPIDANLRRPGVPSIIATDGLSFTRDGGNITNAVHRCVGVGKCRADLSASGGFMCPSYQATKDEKDSTRGRARVLQELMRGTFAESWRSDEVRQVLDLCLSCKACGRDCPAGVDMSRLKSEMLHRRYRGRLRPRDHYVLGWLPRWLRLARIMSRVLNVVLRPRFIQKTGLTVAGLTPQRTIPRFDTSTAIRSNDAAWTAAAEGASVVRGGDLASSPHRLTGTVVLWADSFSKGFARDSVRDAVFLLQRQGLRVLVAPENVCCGLTWISTGQLNGARKRMTHLVEKLAPLADQGVPIVGLEPSCTAALREDLPELLPNDPRAATISEQTRTLSEVLMHCEEYGGSPWKAPDLRGDEVLVQPHCHQYAVLGMDDYLSLLELTGITVTTVTGCCGMAGNFGMQRGHYDLSVKVAENSLLPALQTKDDATVLLADGFSCRMQAEQIAGVKAAPLASYLAERIRAASHQ